MRTYPEIQEADASPIPKASLRDEIKQNDIAEENYRIHHFKKVGTILCDLGYLTDFIQQAGKTWKRVIWNRIPNTDRVIASLYAKVSNSSVTRLHRRTGDLKRRHAQLRKPQKPLSAREPDQSAIETASGRFETIEQWISTEISQQQISE